MRATTTGSTMCLYAIEYFTFHSYENVRRVTVVSRVRPRSNQPVHVYLCIICSRDTQARHPEFGTAIARRNVSKSVHGLDGFRPSPRRIDSGSNWFKSELTRAVLHFHSQQNCLITTIIQHIHLPMLLPTYV